MGLSASVKRSIEQYRSEQVRSKGDVDRGGAEKHWSARPIQYPI